jgi:D-beta-D-heptose 7-phosphate kinase/D-beta-D-heptose 1-phosphate adenosyltransferase
MRELVLVSGGFDPVHSGHIYLIQEASKYGDVIVLLNSDKWLREKKGREFLPFVERETIMKSLKNVIDVLSFDDSDKTCVDGIRKAINKYPNHKIMFANGGDRNDKTSPDSEKKFCDKNNIISLWGVGGEYKSNSSSKILKRWQEEN